MFEYIVCNFATQFPTATAMRKKNKYSSKEEYDRLLA